MWNFETIDSADISDESATFEIEPMSEIKVGHNVCFKSLVRSVDPETINLWYGQDASGAIWKIDIVVSHTVSVMCDSVCVWGGGVLLLGEGGGTLQVQFLHAVSIG